MGFSNSTRPCLSALEFSKKIQIFSNSTRPCLSPLEFSKKIQIFSNSTRPCLSAFEFLKKAFKFQPYNSHVTNTRQYWMANRERVACPDTLVWSVAESFRVESFF